MTRDPVEPAVMQRAHERKRLTVTGTRTDDGTRCTVVLVAEISGTWALYPHGASQLGVRVPQTEALTIAQAIQDDAP